MIDKGQTKCQDIFLDIVLGDTSNPYAMVPVFVTRGGIHRREMINNYYFFKRLSKENKIDFSSYKHLVKRLISGDTSLELETEQELLTSPLPANSIFDSLFASGGIQSVFDYIVKGTSISVEGHALPSLYFFLFRNHYKTQFKEGRLHLQRFDCDQNTLEDIFPSTCQSRYLKTLLKDTSYKFAFVPITVYDSNRSSIFMVDVQRLLKFCINQGWSFDEYVTNISMQLEDYNYDSSFLVQDFGKPLRLIQSDSAIYNKLGIRSLVEKYVRSGFAVLDSNLLTSLSYFLYMDKLKIKETENQFIIERFDCTAKQLTTFNRVSKKVFSGKKRK